MYSNATCSRICADHKMEINPWSADGAYDLSVHRSATVRSRPRSMTSRRSYKYQSPLLRRFSERSFSSGCMMSGVPRSSFLLPALIGTVALASNHSISLPPISSSPSNASQILDPRLASFSFELSYLPTFAGNISNPNVLTQELMQRLVERTGVGPDIRPGGITVYAVLFSKITMVD